MVMKKRMLAVACAALAFALPAVAQNFGSPELIAAASEVTPMDPLPRLPNSFRQDML